MSSIEGLAFVATGYLEKFGRYDYYTNAHDFSELKEYIEARGGFLRSAVSSKTDYLICNDQSEKTTKLKKALELGIPIITEQEFLQMAKESKIIERLPQTFEIKNGFLKKYNGSDSKVEIPDGVTTICKNAFCGGSFNHNLTTLSVPESVKKIGPRALARCRELKKLSVFCGDFEIENNAFYQTDRIEKIELNSDEIIALEAFKKLISFSELKIPLLLYALRQKGGSLLRAECSSQCVTYKDRLMTEIIKRNDSELLNNLFSCFKRKIALDKINSYIEAVKNSPELLSILLTYKDANYSVEEESKAEETKTELELGLRQRTLSEWRKIFTISTLEDGYQISKCKVDQPVVIVPGEIDGKPVRSIAKGAFSQNRTIEQIQIPDGVKIIGEKAFWGCQNLKRVVLPEELTSIGESAFEGCYKADFKLPKSIASIGCRAFRGCANLSSVTIPDGTTTIGDSDFEGCACLASVTIPDSVTEIGERAFSGCKSLVSITIPEGVTDIGRYAFEGCESLVSVVIPEGVVRIETSAFEGCTSLAEAVIPDGVKIICDAAFRGCASLASIAIPKSVWKIGDSAFRGCASLAEAVIPDGVTKIESSMFDGCKRLGSVTIPDSVTEIGSLAFRGCENLTIRTPAGSFAEKYAKENNIPFVAE